VIAFRNRSLHARFLLGLTLLMTVLGAMFIVLLYFHLRHQFEAETEEKASLILAQVEAVQGYIRKTLRPVMYELLPPDAFVIEAMSTSYVTRMVMSDLNLSPDHHVYRRAAVGARNPDFEANALERDILDRFRADPGLRRYRTMIREGDEEMFVVARPVVFEGSCMHCHGTPAEAPRELIARYGDSRGFGRAAGELAGLDMVSMPVSGDMGKLRGATIGFATMFGLGMVVVFILIQFFFDRLVVHNLRRVSEVMRRHFPGEADASLCGAGVREGEIDELLSGIEAFARHLGEARSKLEDYAANLERKVDERTAELRDTADERREDVRLFVDLLNSLNRSQSRADLLRDCLAMVGQRFGASRVSYVCSLTSGQYTSWPTETQAPELPPDWLRLVAEGITSILPDRAYVPVQTSDLSRGLLCLYFGQTVELSAQTTGVLRALGLQMGIAMENLDALDTLLRQNLLLGSIFEGISDPLFLVDEECRVVTANASAEVLAAAVRALPDAPDALLAALAGLAPGSGGPCPLKEIGTESPQAPRELTMAGERSFSAHIYPLLDAGRHIGRAVVYLRENTAEKRMLARMQQNEKVVAVGKLAAGLAHEINNPLGVILCYTELLRQSLPEGQALADLAVIERHATKAKSVLRDLMDFARSRSPAPGWCDPGRVITEMAGVFQVQAQARQAALNVDAAPDIPPVAADAQALEQVAANLLLNALDAVPETGGRIDLQVRHDRAAGEVVLTVADNGPGIASEHKSRIFDPFFTTKEVGRGTGLGLAVVYGLVRDMGGRVEVVNREGAVFFVRLPAIPDERRAQDGPLRNDGERP
jgi:signal transduction histidine kinase